MEQNGLVVFGMVSVLLLLLAIYLAVKRGEANKENLALKQQMEVKETEYSEQIAEIESTLTTARVALRDATKPEVLSSLKDMITGLTEESERLTAFIHSSTLDLQDLTDQNIDNKLAFFDRQMPVGTSTELKARIKESQIEQRKLYEESIAVTVFFGLWDNGYKDTFYHSQPYREDVKYEVNKTNNQLILNCLDQWSNTQLLITAFNLGCEQIINGVKYQSLERAASQIQKLARKIDKKYVQEAVHITSQVFELLEPGLIAGGGRGCRYNGLLQGHEGYKKLIGDEKAIWTTDINLTISDEYIEAKIYELRLQYEYVELLAEEKERIKEEKLVAAELKKQTLAAEKQENDIKSKLEALNSTDNAVSEELRETIRTLEAQLAQVIADKERAISMAQLTRSGFVYVISNVGTMGSDVVKIGMTRRIDPMERVRELGDASVPFQFDVHTIIRTDDAPRLEKQLHERFKHKRVNLMNNRKEFFEVALPDVKQAILELYASDFEFNEMTSADDYMRSKAIRLNKPQM